MKGLKPFDRKKHRGLKRPYSLKRTFGATFAGMPQEFNFNTLRYFPDQNALGLFNGCTAFAQTGVASNEDFTLYDDADWYYRKTLAVDGSLYGSACDLISSLKVGTVYGVKTKTMSETDALKNRRSPYLQVEKVNDWFDGIITAMWTVQGGVSLGTEWQTIFENTGSDGLIPPFKANSNWQEGHNWIAYGVKFINGEPHIICESHQGPNFGNKGECYFNRKQINDLLSSKGASAFGQRHVRPEDVIRVKMTIMDFITAFFQQLAKLLARPSQPSTTGTTTPAVIGPSPSMQIYVEPKPTDNLTLFAQAITDYEGKPGDRNYRNNNPGNCKFSYVGYATIYGNVTCDKEGFAIFPTWAIGFLYLKNLLKSKAFLYPDWTVGEYMSRLYAPVSENNPVAYTAYLNKRVPQVMRMGDLLT